MAVGVLLITHEGIGAALLAATWTRLGPGERVARVLVLAVLVALAVGLAVR